MLGGVMRNHDLRAVGAKLCRREIRIATSIARPIGTTQPRGRSRRRRSDRGSVGGRACASTARTEEREQHDRGASHQPRIAQGCCASWRETRLITSAMTVDFVTNAL